MITPSIFSRIVCGEIPAYKVAEDKRHLAILDVSPLVQGHTLIIPKEQTDYLFDLTPEAFTSLQLFSLHVARALKKAIDCVRIGSAVIGLEVPHAHIHLVPLNEAHDLDFSRKRQLFTAVQMQETASRIIRFLDV